jgi:hypothetical protein
LGWKRDENDESDEGWARRWRREVWERCMGGSKVRVGIIKKGRRVLDRGEAGC